MSEIAIQVTNLGKRFRLGRRPRYLRLSEAPARMVSALTARLRGRRGPSPDEAPSTLWALRNVSFEVREGEVLGIIGRNGAGKSTLLKILSRITRPTEGEVRIRGRVGSLLEVGTGFHPELTGRENVYLNGTILGMRKAEIDRKFDEIVAFSEVEKFLDTQVKHYSSGMQMRLAFAVAAHLEPEVLLVDEVLAVGDAPFQRKCLGRMSQVAQHGRTVLFVSHNMGAVSRLCDRVLVLGDGRCEWLGEAQQGVAHYLASGAVGVLGRADLRQAPRWPGAKQHLLTSISTHRPDGAPASDFAAGDGLVVRVGYRLERDLAAYCQINVADETGERLMTLRSSHAGAVLDLAAGEGTIECRLDDLRLLSGEYTLSVELGCRRGVAQWLDYVPDALRMHVHLGNYLQGADVQRGQAWFAQRSSWNCSASRKDGNGD